MAIYEMVPVTELGAQEFEAVGEQLHELVTIPAIHEMLEARHFWGVIDRHSISAEASAESLKRSAVAMQQQKMSAYIVMLENDVKPIGMATIQPDLALWRQLLPFNVPAALTRNNVFGMKVPVHGANVAAWSDVGQTPDVLMSQATAELYGFLAEKEPHSWTIEPLKANAVDVHIGLPQAGYRIYRPGTYRYDDMEPGRRAPLKSVLYESRT